MNNFSFRRTTHALLLLSAFLLVAAPADLHGSQGGRREYLTPAEVEGVRNNQELDKRVGVFIKAAERRLLMLTDPQAAAKEAEAAAKQAAKDAEMVDAADVGPSGSVVKGTRAELLSDIANILDEAITNVDDAVLHSEKSTLIPKAVRKLAEACNRMLPKLVVMREQIKDEDERDRLELAVENAQQILEAAKKVPAEEKKKGDEKKKN